jgi:hypothetical protein
MVMRYVWTREVQYRNHDEGDEENDAQDITLKRVPENNVFPSAL